MTSEITNWEILSDILNELSKSKIDEPCNSKTRLYAKLLRRLNQFLQSKTTSIAKKKVSVKFDCQTVDEKHSDIFCSFVETYHQITIENDIIDINMEMACLENPSQSLTFSLICVGNWIRLHYGNVDKIYFLDDEKTLLNDRQISGFLNKIENVRKDYVYYGTPVKIYYKFYAMPSQDVVEYLASYGVIAVTMDYVTATIRDIENHVFDKVVVDQGIIVTLCSNLSHDLLEFDQESIPNQETEILCESKTIPTPYRSEDERTKILQNYANLSDFLNDKTLLVNQDTYEQSCNKFNYNKQNKNREIESERFNKLCERMEVISDIVNPRFNQLKPTEVLLVSCTEANNAIFATTNYHLCNKLDAHFPEIIYKKFMSVQLYS